MTLVSGSRVGFLLAICWATLTLAPPARAERLNLARFQNATADSVDGKHRALFATDGIVSNDSRWVSSGPGPHWIQVTFPLVMEIGSAHVYTGKDDRFPVVNFSLQYRSGSSWIDIPGARVAGNGATERNIVFARPVRSARFRLFTGDGAARVKELALFPPNGPGGHPVGTDVVLNLAWQRDVLASSIYGNNFPKLAVDGFTDNGSRWVSEDDSGADTLEITLSGAHRIGSAHVYTGWGSGDAVAEFKLQYHDGSAWRDIPGTQVTGNGSIARRLAFASPVTASRVRFHSPGSGRKRVKEILLFPASGGGDYPPGTNVSSDPRPTREFEDFSDSYYRIRNRRSNTALVSATGAATLTTGDETAAERNYQLLLNVGTDTFRLRNRVSLRCLEVEAASREPGAAVVESTYEGLPHQNWKFVDLGSGDYRIVNEWSGLSLETLAGATAAGSPVVQTVWGNRPSQRWFFTEDTHFPKKGLAGWLGQSPRFGNGWCYNWGRGPGTGLPPGVLFMPMQHNAFWPGWGSLPEKYPEWNSRGRPTILLGFNEPDRPDQADMSVSKAIDLWPRLERMNIPLASPVTANSNNSWMVDFMGGAGRLGYRTDYVAVHWYGGPNGGNSQGFIDRLRSIRERYGRPLWLTEFSTVDWGGNARWTEEDNYNFFAEFFWRAEDLPWLKKYSMFIFSGNPPSSPSAPTAPRGNIFRSDKSTLTALGELYAAWDGDQTIHEDTAYLLHGKRMRHRLRNQPGGSGPTAANIRLSDRPVQWVLLPAGGSRKHIISLADGRRLRVNGTRVDLAPPLSTGRAVEWILRKEKHGWVYIDHPSTGKRLRLEENLDVNVVDDSRNWEANKFRFIRPIQPQETEPPRPPRGLRAVAGDGQVSLSWTASGEADLLAYSVYRGTRSGGPWSRLASGLRAPAHVDTRAINGRTYHYVVVALDVVGHESGFSGEVSATPVAPEPPVRFVRGECDGEGGVDISDAVCILGWLFLGGSEPGCVAATNVNGDEMVNISDPVSLLDFLFLGGPPPPPPFPACGAASLATDETLGCESSPGPCR